MHLFTFLLKLKNVLPTDMRILINKLAITLRTEAKPLICVCLHFDDILVPLIWSGDSVIFSFILHAHCSFIFSFLVSSSQFSALFDKHLVLSVFCISLTLSMYPYGYRMSEWTSIFMRFFTRIYVHSSLLWVVMRCISWLARADWAIVLELCNSLYFCICSLILFNFRILYASSGIFSLTNRTYKTSKIFKKKIVELYFIRDFNPPKYSLILLHKLIIIAWSFVLSCNCAYVNSIMKYAQFDNEWAFSQWEPSICSTLFAKSEVNNCHFGACSQTKVICYFDYFSHISLSKPTADCWFVES